MLDIYENSFLVDVSQNKLDNQNELIILLSEMETPQEGDPEKFW